MMPRSANEIWSEGNVAADLAIHTIKAANGWTAIMRSRAISGKNGTRSALIKPLIVIGAMSGATAIFTGIVTSDSCPLMATMTGVQRIVAESGTDSAVMRDAGMWPPDFSSQYLSIIGAMKRIPAVARTESAKPGSSA